MPPPLVFAVLPDMVELMTVRVLDKPLTIPPPPLPAELPEMVELVTVRMPPPVLEMPPPPAMFAVLPEIVELETVRVPVFLMPPPLPEFIVLPEIVELVMVRVPELKKPPPLPEVKRAPETVTPEIERLPPAAMLKMLKLRFVLMVPEELSRPLIIREEEPGPVMVRVPTVPPPPEAVALAFKMVGNEALTVLFWESSVMVPVMLKLITSSPAVALARSMAARRDPVPESKLLETIMGEFEGVILSSRPRSSSLRRIPFNALLDVKRFFKEFKNIGGVL